MDREQAHKLVENILIDLRNAVWNSLNSDFPYSAFEKAQKQILNLYDSKPNGEIVVEEPKRELPKDKRVIRTKSTGDRVYLIDETAKTKAWVTSPEILAKLGFELADVQDVDDKDLLGYAMTASVYRVEE